MLHSYTLPTQTVCQNTIRIHITPKEQSGAAGKALNVGARNRWKTAVSYMNLEVIIAVFKWIDFLDCGDNILYLKSRCILKYIFPF